MRNSPDYPHIEGLKKRKKIKAHLCKKILAFFRLYDNRLANFPKLENVKPTRFKKNETWTKSNH